MSLLDMMNFALHSFVAAQRLLQHELVSSIQRATAKQAALTEEPDKQRILSLLELCMKIFCQQMLLARTESRIQRVYSDITDPKGIPERILAGELQSLLEAIDDDINTERFYHYPSQKGLLVLRVPGDWNATIRAFPSSETEITEGVDCYALEHNTAAVFQMMRVAEIGMRALARERKVSFPKHPLESADWQNILDETEKKARAATTGMPRGPKRDAMQAFYSGAIGQLHAFKDTYRKWLIPLLPVDQLIDFGTWLVPAGG